MRNKIIYFSLIILMYNANYEINYAENNVAIPNDQQSTTVKIDSSTANIDLKNFSYQERRLFNFKWGTADCTFNDVQVNLLLVMGRFQKT